MAKKRLQVRTRRGKQCPRENGVRPFITDGRDKKGKDLAKEEERYLSVPDTIFYRRLIKDGSLVTPAIEKAEAEAAAKPAPK